ncbi:hypothetical protein V5F89_12385 [Pelagerythrobacter marensis]|uniref:Uncharacterized protein n=1 Tax=Pelagerythrobacter marensis TaxID=543877 RepID=A0ABZ2D204_9SPHN
MTGPSFDPAIGRKVLADRRLIEQLLALAGGAGRMAWHSQRKWQSGTFRGARHQMCVEFEGLAEIEGGERLIAGLSIRHFAVPGVTVVEAQVTESKHVAQPPHLTVTAELLTLEED